MSSAVEPLLQRKEYGAVPPVIVRFIPPFVCPKQATLETVALAVKGADGWVIVIPRNEVHPFKSETFTK